MPPNGLARQLQLLGALLQRRVELLKLLPREKAGARARARIVPLCLRDWKDAGQMLTVRTFAWTSSLAGAVRLQRDRSAAKAFTNAAFLDARAYMAISSALTRQTFRGDGRSLRIR